MYCICAYSPSTASITIALCPISISGLYLTCIFVARFSGVPFLSSSTELDAKHDKLVSCRSASKVSLFIVVNVTLFQKSDFENTLKHYLVVENSFLAKNTLTQYVLVENVFPKQV